MNLLLAGLGPDERKRLAPFLEPIDTILNQSLAEQGDQIRYVYFPSNSVTSLVQTMIDGASVETGIIGLEGMVGLSLWFHEPTSPIKMFVQVPGKMMRMKASVFVREVRDTESPLNTAIARYANAFLTTTSLIAACNRVHHVDARLCRWLMMVYNRVPGNAFPMRHEYLAYMLGVHRPSVSIAARALKDASLIDYERGRLQVLDAKKLAAGACECYAVIEKLFEDIYGRQLMR